MFLFIWSSGFGLMFLSEGFLLPFYIRTIYKLTSFWPFKMQTHHYAVGFKYETFKNQNTGLSLLRFSNGPTILILTQLSDLWLVFIITSNTWPFKLSKFYVVYFHQLSGAEHTWKLVEILFSAVFNFASKVNE